MTIGAPIDVLAWQRALAAEPLIVVTAFTPTRDDLRVTVQAAAARYAIPVRLHARVSRRWHDVFDFTVEPHPIKAGDTSMVRIIEIVAVHATSLAVGAHARAWEARMRQARGRL